MFGEPAIVFRKYEDGSDNYILVTHGGDRKLTEQRGNVREVQWQCFILPYTITRSLNDT